MRIITLTTDFGLDNWFVGAMKGVILGINPRAVVVDLAHGVPAGDIRAGAFALAAGCRFFPRGTVHVAVVDPGVGSDREAIAVETADFLFVGPDNGVLSLALSRESIRSIRRLGDRRWFLHPVSSTFHGRDVFAPVAAHLSRGLSCRQLGPALKDCVRITWPEPHVQAGAIQGEVICLDRFGNAVTNIPNALLPACSALAVVIRRKTVVPVERCYQAVPAGQPVAVPGSSGYLEIAVNRGHAARRLRLAVGSAVRLRWHASERPEPQKL